MQDVTPAELSERLARGEPLVVLDVREPRERAQCALALPATAADLHIPMGLVAGRLGALRVELAGRTGVIYCHHGVRSRLVGEWLERQGVPGLLNLEGGIDAWSRTVDPTIPRY